MPQSFRLDVSPDEEGENLGLAIKYDGDTPAYGFSAQSYGPFGPELRDPLYELPDEAYEVVVEAQAGEISTNAWFRL